MANAFQTVNVIFSSHFGHIHRPGQEVGGHIADEDDPICFRREVKFHTMDCLIAAVVYIGG